MTRHKISAETGFGKELIQARTHYADGWLGVIGALQGCGLGRLHIAAGGRRRVNDLRDRYFPFCAEKFVHFVEGLA